MQLAGHAVCLEQVLREAVEPPLQRFRVCMGDMTRDDLALFQVHLLELIGLVDRSGEQGLLHEKQVVIRLDPHDGIDDILEARCLRLWRSEADPIPLPSLLVRREARDETGLLIEYPAAVDDRAGEQVPHPFTRGQRVRREKNVQATHLCSQRRDGELVVRKGQRPERHRRFFRRRQVPDLVVVVFGMGLPDDDQSFTVARFFDPVAERFAQHLVLLRNGKRRQARLELLPTGFPVRRRVRHAKGLVVDVSRGAQPVGQRHLRPFVQLLH